jgi:hypothetical protein
MTKSGLLLILSSVLGLGLLPGCLGHSTGARVTPEQKLPFQPPTAVTIVQDQSPYPVLANRSHAVGVAEASEPPEVPPPSDAAGKPVDIRQTGLEKPQPQDLLPARAGTSDTEIRPVPPPVEVKSTSPELEAPVPSAKLPFASSDPPLLGAFRGALNDEPEKTLEYLKGFDVATQDFLLRVLPALARLAQKPLEQLNAEEVSVLQEQFEGLLETLRPFTKLAITRLCCCKWIKGYGNYEPLPEDHLFHPTSKKDYCDGEKVNVYVELRNFRCEMRDRYHEIRLSSSVEIRDPREPPDAKPLWYYGFKDQQQPVRSRVQLHDFFGSYWFIVPHIPPGTYILTFHVADETSPDRRRVASKSQEFHVTAMPMGAP